MSGPCFDSTRLIAAVAASRGCMPCRMYSTTVCAPTILMHSSPTPVDPAAPTALSTYSPHPTSGESPMRPGILKARPLVVVMPDRSPASSSARQLIVPHRFSGQVSGSRSGSTRPAAVGRRLVRRHGAALRRPPVVDVAHLLAPAQPLLARRLGEQIFLLEPVRDGEAQRARRRRSARVRCAPSPGAPRARDA